MALSKVNGQWIAEELRERFSYAAPDLFRRPAESGVQRTAVSIRGR
jgi:hypothetical protein